MGDKTITVTMTGDIEGELKNAFKVEGKDGEIQIADVKREMILPIHLL